MFPMKGMPVPKGKKPAPPMKGKPVPGTSGKRGKPNAPKKPGGKTIAPIPMATASAVPQFGGPPK